MANIREAGTGYSATNLKLESTITMNMFFLKDYIDQSKYAIATFTDHYGNEKSVRVEGSEFLQLKNDTDWYVPVTGMAVADCGAAVTVTIYEQDGTEVAKGTDSIESYVQRKSNSHALFVTIVKFATSAKAVFAK